jgi:hypothetical protein
MTDEKDTITVHVNVNITPISIQAVVENAKKLTGTNEKGSYKVDTADILSNLISTFLWEKDFETFAKDISNYTR